MNEISSEQMEKNFEHLVKQLKFTGMPETLQFELKEKMAKGDPDFTITFKTDMGRHPSDVTLNFRKSDKGNYFFNSYDLEVKPEHGEPLKQRFYVRSPETGKIMGPDGIMVDKTINSTITLKEALNLLTPPEERQRHVLKNFVSQKGEVYSSWVSLDMTQKIKDNYPLVQRPVFALEEKLLSLPVRIKEMESPELRGPFLESLQKGNRQAATIISPAGSEYRRFVEVNASHKTVNIYEGENRLSPGKAIPQDRPQQVQGQEPSTQQRNTQKQSAGPQQDEGMDEGLGDHQPKKRNKRKIAA